MRDFYLLEFLFFSSLLNAIFPRALHADTDGGPAAKSAKREGPGLLSS